MNKIELITVLAETEKLSRQDAKRCVETFFDSMAEALTAGERVEIRGLCSFYTKTYKSYHGPIPKPERSSPWRQSGCRFSRWERS